MSMIQKLRTWVAAIVMVVAFGGTTATMAAPTTAVAAGCDTYFLTIPPWYRGLTDDQCNIKTPGSTSADLQNFVWTIVLNIIEIMLHLAGYVAIFFIIFGGFKYMTSAGSADGMTKAKGTIMNAVIGLVISIMSIAIVNVVAGAIR